MLRLHSCGEIYEWTTSDRIRYMDGIRCFYLSHALYNEMQFLVACKIQAFLSLLSLVIFFFLYTKEFTFINLTNLGFTIFLTTCHHFPNKFVLYKLAASFINNSFINFYNYSNFKEVLSIKELLFI